MSIKGLTVVTSREDLVRPARLHGAGAAPVTVMDARERKTPFGADTADLASTTVQGIRYNNQRFLSNDELRRVYKQVPDIRACVDSIARVVSTYDWSIVPLIAPDDPNYERVLDACADVQAFLSAPDADGTTWQDLTSMCTRDLGIYDAWAWEHEFGSDGLIEGIGPMPGGDTMPLVDDRRRLLSYRVESGGEYAQLDPEEVLYLNLFPSTEYVGGTPLIETLMLEWIALLRWMKNTGALFDNDEIGAGILVLSNVAGEAAERLEKDWNQRQAGNRNSLRILSSSRAGMEATASWVSFDRSLVELGGAEVVHEIRRTIWRCYGCKPVTMGDTEATPRATAEVQVDAEDSYLIGPILELIQAKVNARTIPLIVGDAELASMLAFEFDRGDAVGADESKTRAETHGEYLDRKVLTINEVREEIGRPPVPWGNEPAGMGAAEGDEGDDTQDDNDEGPADGPDDPGATSEDAPGSVDPDETSGRLWTPSRATAARRRRAARLRGAGVAWVSLPHTGGCGCEPSRRSEYLPSDWQPGGKFEGRRTVDLGRLAEAVRGYAEDVEPLYRRARLDAVSAVGSELGADGLVDDEARARALRRVDHVLDRLSEQWAITTAKRYREAAAIGRDAATHWTGDGNVAGQWRERGERYADTAMGYLTGPGGLIRDIRERVRAALVLAERDTAAAGVIQTRGRAVAARVPHVREEEGTVALVLAAVGRAFERNKHRVNNWSGKLVELSHSVFGDGMVEAATVADEEDASGARDTEWYVQWVAVLDKGTCPTCEDEGQRGFFPASQLVTVPGGATECRARCRCVLVYWTAAEVAAGSAVDLAGQ